MKTSLTRIFVLEANPRYSVAKARHFGSLHYLFSDGRSFNRFDFQATADAVLQRLCEEDFNPDNDLICLTGELAPVAAMASAVAGRWGRFSLLQFNPMTSNYDVHHFQEGPQ